MNAESGAMTDPKMIAEHAKNVSPEDSVAIPRAQSAFPLYHFIYNALFTSKIREASALWTKMHEVSSNPSNQELALKVQTGLIKILEKYLIHIVKSKKTKEHKDEMGELHHAGDYPETSLGKDEDGNKWRVYLQDNNLLLNINVQGKEYEIKLGSTVEHREFKPSIKEVFCGYDESFPDNHVSHGTLPGIYQFGACSSVGCGGAALSELYLSDIIASCCLECCQPYFRSATIPNVSSVIVSHVPTVICGIVALTGCVGAACCISERCKTRHDSKVTVDENMTEIMKAATKISNNTFENVGEENEELINELSSLRRNMIRNLTGTLNKETERIKASFLPNNSLSETRREEKKGV